MATILTKKKDTTGAPVAGDLTNSAGGAELAVNTADKRLYTKDSGGNVVEVGTNPGAAVTFTAGTVSAPAITTTGDTNTGVFFPAADTIAFAEGGAEAMRITSSGNLDIGGSAYARRLSVKDATNTVVVIEGSNAGSSNINFADNDSENPGSINYGHATNYMAFQTAGSERMRIDSSGNVGIGSTSPSTFDDANGGRNFVLQSTGTQRGVITFASQQTSGADNVLGIINFVDSDSTNTAYRGARILGMLGSDANSAYLRFDTANSAAGTERMRITSGGNVGIGTTSPGAKLDVVGQTKITSISAVNGSALDTYGVTGDKTVAQWYLSKYDNDNTTAQILVRFAMNNGITGQGQINGNGANAAAFGSYSDRRLKENIVDLPPQLENIMALRPVEFDYIQSEGGGHQISFIAQDIEQIYPDAVGEREDGMKTLTGWDKTTARLVKAIQELKAITDAQATRIEALEAEVAALKAK